MPKETRRKMEKREERRRIQVEVVNEHRVLFQNFIHERKILQTLLIIETAELTEMDSGLKGQRVKGRTPKAGSSKKQTEEATSSFMEDEKTSMTPTEMSSQFVATVR